MKKVYIVYYLFRFNNYLGDRTRGQKYWILNCTPKVRFFQSNFGVSTVSLTSGVLFYIQIILQYPCTDGMGNARFIICFGDVFGDFFLSSGFSFPWQRDYQRLLAWRSFSSSPIAMVSSLLSPSFQLGEWWLNLCPHSFKGSGRKDETCWWSSS